MRTRTLVILFTMALLLGVLFTGCQSTPPDSGAFSQITRFPASEGTASDQQSASLILHEGDSVRITFPGAPNLSTVALIRRDGRISLPLVGEVQAAGLTPRQLEQQLLKLYEPQLQTKEVNVSVESAAFPIYVTGAVLRPGRINADRPLTALEAVMEAGVDYNRANLKSVRVIRNENGKAENHILNLKRILNGAAADQFKLKPNDIVFVPEKFSWF